MGHLGSVRVRSNWIDAVPILRPFATRVGESGRGLERTSKQKRTNGMGTHALDDNDFVEPTHKKENQGKRFDCVSVGKRSEEGPQGLDAWGNFRRNQPTKRTSESKWRA